MVDRLVCQTSSASAGVLVSLTDVSIEEIVRPLPFMRAEDYPAFAEIWDNDDDDDLFAPVALE